MARAKNPTHPLVWSRRFVQIALFAFFFYLVLNTTEHPIDRVEGPVTLFFDINPLVLITTWITANAVPAILLLSLITVAVTLIFGRWFCGWVCPFGALHNFISSLRGGKLKQRREQAEHSAWQAAKYYVLIAVLVGCLIGVNLAGWLDPFSFFYRSLTIAVLPLINAGIHGFFTWIYEADPAIFGWHLTSVSEPTYSFLREYFLYFEPAYFYGAVVIGLLFAAVVLLNLYRPRFWCRYICPLGATLGVIGKNPLVRLQKNLDVCNECGLCVVDCQGGAEPQADGWKPAECFYCFNCESACPHDALSLGVGRESSS